ncbi:MAG: hypothetical protein ACI9G1_001932 [Pirellulaceae bacterium]
MSAWPSQRVRQAIRGAVLRSLVELPGFPFHSDRTSERRCARPDRGRLAAFTCTAATLTTVHCQASDLILGLSIVEAKTIDVYIVAIGLQKRLLSRNWLMERFTDFLPRIILCAPGQWKSVDEVWADLGRDGLEGVEIEIQEVDPRIETAFDASRCPWEIPFGDHELNAIGTHSSVLYALSPDYDSEDAFRWCNAMSMLAGQLFVAGAAGIKCDSSGITHPLESWKETLQNMESALKMLESDDEEKRATGHVRLWVLAYRTYIQGPMWDGVQFHDCGMHLLGGAGTIISDEIATQAFGNSDENRFAGVTELIEAFSLYQLVESGDSELKSGDTFRADDDGPGFIVELEADEFVDAENYLNNPYGRWRFTEVID